MSNFGKHPRAGTGTYVALQVLHSLGGIEADREWRKAAQAVARISPEQWDVVTNQLLGTGMVFQRHDKFHISDDGLVAIGVPVEVATCDPLPVVAPRYVGPQRELSRKNIVRMPMMREGSMDYRNIPSLMGDRRIAHGTKAVSADA